MSKKKVALIIPTLRNGGAERVVSRMSHILASDYELTVFLFDGKDPTYPLFCPFVDMGCVFRENAGFLSKIAYYFKVFRKLKALKKQYAVDVAFSFGDRANGLNVLTRRGEKVIVSVREYGRLGARSFKKKWMLAYYRFIYGKAHQVVSVSEVISKTLVGKCHVAPWKAETVYNAYDALQIEEQGEQPLPQGETDFFEGKKVFISVGNPRWEKGYDLLIEAFSLLAPFYPDIRLCIVGKVDNTDGLKLLKQIKDLDLQEKVRLAGYHKNPYAFIKRSFAFVLSSLSEGFPNALSEAMLCGVPVIATDCLTGPREILSPGREPVFCEGVADAPFGLLTQVTAQALAQGMEKLLLNPEKAEYYGAKALLRGKDFTYENWRKNLCRVIDKEKERA